MNNIFKSVSNLKEVYRKAGLEFSFDSEKMIKELTENSYKNNAIENLVNVFSGEESTIDISEFNLEWTKQNTRQEEFKYVLSCLGVDVSRLSNL